MPEFARSASLFVSQVACILSFSSDFLSLFPHLFLFQEPLPGPCLRKKKKEEKKKKKRGEELRGGGERAGDTPKPISRGKEKKSRLILDGLEPKSWRPEEVRVVLARSLHTRTELGC